MLHVFTQQFRFTPQGFLLQVGDNLIVPLVPESPLQSVPSETFLQRQKFSVNEHSSISQMHSAVASPCEIFTALTQSSGCVSPVVPHWNRHSSSSWMMLPSCQLDGMFLPSFAMRRDQVLLNIFIPCLSCTYLGYKRATTQTSLFPASQLPAVLVGRWAESVNGIWPFYCQLNFQLSVHPAVAWAAAPRLALKCPDGRCNPVLACGTWVWACTTLTLPCLLCETFSFMLLLPKKQSQGLLLQQISGWKQAIDKWCWVLQSSFVFCFAQLHYQLSVVSGFISIRLLQRP